MTYPVGHTFPTGSTGGKPTTQSPVFSDAKIFSSKIKHDCTPIFFPKGKEGHGMCEPPKMTLADVAWAYWNT